MLSDIVYKTEIGNKSDQLKNQKGSSYQPKLLGLTHLVLCAISEECSTFTRIACEVLNLLALLLGCFV